VPNTASNWGRWSADDQLGSLNLLTADRVVTAAGLVTEGRVLSLAYVLRHDVVRVEDRPPPVYVLTVDAGDYATGAKRAGEARIADDYLSMPVATGTHIDGLVHAWGEDGLYNGHSPDNVRSRGAKVCGIENVRGIVTRGVLADVAGLRGERWLPPSHVITPDELEAALSDVTVGPGDALLIRTGWLAPENVKDRGLASTERQEPGIGAAAAAWIAEHDVALVGCDNLGVEVLPPEDPAGGMPVHLALLNRLGVYLVELMRLDELAATGRREFLFVTAPLRIRGGVNSPVNPLAVL
jgi:kynurenine formamidase